MRKELNEARKALARGRSDESLVHLWNVLEPARLANDRRTLRAVAELASEIQARGEVVEQREAERLLEAVQETAEQERAPEAVVALPGEEAGNGGFATEDEVAAEVEVEQEEQAAGGLARWIFPLIFIVVVIANILNGIFGD